MRHIVVFSVDRLQLINDDQLLYTSVVAVVLCPQCGRQLQVADDGAVSLPCITLTADVGCYQEDNGEAVDEYHSDGVPGVETQRRIWIIAAAVKVIVIAVDPLPSIWYMKLPAVRGSILCVGPYISQPLAMVVTQGN